MDDCTLTAVSTKQHMLLVYNVNKAGIIRRLCRTGNKFSHVKDCQAHHMCCFHHLAQEQKQTQDGIHWNEFVELASKICMYMFIVLHLHKDVVTL